MSWVRIDDTMLEHPKWVRAVRLGGEATVYLWLQLMTWSSRHLTDGVIPADVLEAIPAPRGDRTSARAWQALAEVGLIERREVNGTLTEVVLHGYLEYQPSRAKVTAERGRKAQTQKTRRDLDRVSRHASEVKPTCNDVPSHPIPSPSLSKKRESEDTRSLMAESPLEPATNPEPPPEPPERPPLRPSQRESESYLGVRPPLRYDFDAAWDPSQEHRARGLELGLTDAQMLERAEHCRRKAYPHGIKSEDDQFFRELAWLARDLETQRWKESARDRKRFEQPGAERA